jgi:hypothetical protein
MHHIELRIDLCSKAKTPWMSASDQPSLGPGTAAGSIFSFLGDMLGDM